MLTFLRQNLAWMILALVLSTALWLIVTLDQNPAESNWFPSIPVEVKDVPAGLTTRSDVLSVRVRVSAPRDVWASRLLLSDRFKAAVDASTAGPGITEAPVVVTSADSRAKIEEIDPARVVLRLEPIKKKDVPVRIRTAGAVPVGYSTRPPRVTPAEVTVSGPQGLVEQVAQVVVDVDLDGVRTSISQAYSVSPQTDTGTAVESVSLSAEKVLVEVTVVQELGYKTVSIQPQVVGTVGFGYQIVGIIVDPATTTVAGDPAALADLSFISTKAVDVSGAVGDVAVGIDPTLPSGVALARAQPLLVRVLISPVESSKTMEVAPSVRGAGDRQVSLGTGSVQVTVSGPMPVLAKLSPRDVQVVVDVSGLVPGPHTVKPVISLPQLLKLVVSVPAEIPLTVR